MRILIHRILLIAIITTPIASPAQQQQMRKPDYFTVFIHAGAKSPPAADVIKQITIYLARKGYSVRAPDNEQDVVGGPGVDYFSTEDAAAAKDVADIVNEAFNALKVDGPKLAPRLQRVRNPPGYIGVWLF
jgi:hypothetical protein